MLLDGVWNTMNVVNYYVQQHIEKEHHSVKELKVNELKIKKQTEFKLRMYHVRPQVVLCIDHLWEQLKN